MLSSKKFEKLTRYLNKTLPKSICHLTDDLDIKIRTILHNQLSRMNFVTTDEFDIQKQAIHEVQKKLNQLEKRLRMLEDSFNEKSQHNQKNHDLKQ